MRSPWKIIKDLASRRKAKEAREPTDEIVALPDPRAEESWPEATPRAEFETSPAIQSESTVEENEGDGEPDYAGAAAALPVQDEQPDTLLAEPLKVGGLQSHQPPPPAVSAIQTAEGQTSAVVLAGGPKKRRANAARARTNLSEPAVAHGAVDEPAVAGKTFLDEATELEVEIKNLRSKLSAKLLEQNAQLRRMLDRYDNK